MSEKFMEQKGRGRMSMISAQCDELRERAKELRNLAPDPDVPYLVPSTKEIMALAMRSAASEMEDAADTIWELRCRLVDAEDRVRKSGELCKLCEREDENAKLRNGYGSMSREHSQTIVELSDAYYSIDQLKAENAKLRELVRDMCKAFMHGNCYRWCEFKEPCNFIEDGRCQWYDRMRELGVEVDE